MIKNLLLILKTLYTPPFIIHHSSLIVKRSTFILNRSTLIIQRSPFIIPFHVHKCANPQLLHFGLRAVQV